MRGYVVEACVDARHKMWRSCLHVQFRRVYTRPLNRGLVIYTSQNTTYISQDVQTKHVDRTSTSCAALDVCAAHLHTTPKQRSCDIYIYYIYTIYILPTHISLYIYCQHTSLSRTHTRTHTYIHIYMLHTHTHLRTHYAHTHTHIHTHTHTHTYTHTHTHTHTHIHQRANPKKKIRVQGLGFRVQGLGFRITTMTSPDL